MLSHHKKAKFQTHSLYLRNTVKVVAFLQVMAMLCQENVAKAWEGRVQIHSMGKFIYALFSQWTVVAIFIG